MSEYSTRLHGGNATKSYTAIGADIDCAAADPLRGAQKGRLPAQVIVWDSGNLKVEYDE